MGHDELKNFIVRVCSEMDMRTTPDDKTKDEFVKDNNEAASTSMISVTISNDYSLSKRRMRKGACPYKSHKCLINLILITLRS